MTQVHKQKISVLCLKGWARPQGLVRADTVITASQMTKCWLIQSTLAQLESLQNHKD